MFAVIWRFLCHDFKMKLYTESNSDSSTSDEEVEVEDGIEKKIKLSRRRFMFWWCFNQLKPEHPRLRLHTNRDKLRAPKTYFLMDYRSSRCRWRIKWFVKYRIVVRISRTYWRFLYISHCQHHLENDSIHFRRVEFMWTLNMKLNKNESIQSWYCSECSAMISSTSSRVSYIIIWNS